MTDHRHRAPTPVGDVVPGDPPVPVTVWPVSAPARRDTVSYATAVRLVHNFTHPGELVVDLTAGPHLARGVMTGRRRLTHLPQPGSRAAGATALIVTGWPTDGAFFTASRSALRPGGCVAVLLAHSDPTLPADVVAAARHGGLRYLQHIVAIGTPAQQRPGTLVIHTDILMLVKPQDGRDG